MIKLSVIIPAYNAQDYIKKCIDSILSQNAMQLEIIVVNDGSTDNTDVVLKEYGSSIKYIYKENGGVSSARNLALDNATGDYVLFIDSDDTLPIGTLEKYIETLNEYDVDIIRGNYQMVYSDGTTKQQLGAFTNSQLVKKYDFKNIVYPFFSRGIRYNTSCASIIKRECIKHRYRLDMPTGEDAIFMMDVYTNAKSLYITSDVVYNYRQTYSGLTGSGLSLVRKYLCNIEISKEILNHLPSWGMDNLYWRTVTILRPVRLTFDKVIRIFLR